MIARDMAIRQPEGLVRLRFPRISTHPLPPRRHLARILAMEVEISSFFCGQADGNYDSRDGVVNLFHDIPWSVDTILNNSNSKLETQKIRKTNFSILFKLIATFSNERNDHLMEGSTESPQTG